MAKLTPEKAATKHADRLKAATQDIIEGVDRVSVAPGKKAAENSAKMRSKIVAAIDSGKWGRRVSAYPLEEWKTDMKEKGVSRIPEGIDRAHDKQVKFYSQLFPYQDTLKGQIEKMPSVTLEDNINRMVSFIRGMAKFEKKD